MKKLIFTLIVLSTFLSAQEEFYQKYYSRDFLTDIHDVESAPDGGFYLTGLYETDEKVEIKLIRTNIYGDTLFTKSFPASSRDQIKYHVDLSVLENGNLMLLGTTGENANENIVLFKLNSSGNILDTHNFANENFYSWSLIATFDGGWLIAGIESYEVHLLKIDSSFQVEWSGDYGRLGRFWTRYGVIQSSDSSFIYSHYRHIVKLDKNGDQLWEKELKQRTAVIAELENASIIAGSSQKLFLFNLSGDSLNEIEFDNYENKIGEPLNLLASNGFIFLSGDYFSKVDTAGNFYFSDRLDFQAYSMVEVKNDISVCGGINNYYEFSEGPSLLRSDTNGFYKVLRYKEPIGGESFYNGSLYELDIRVRGYHGILAELSLNSGRDWWPINVELAESKDRYSIVFPYTLSDSCLLKILVEEDHSLKGQADSVFRIIEYHSESIGFDYIAINQILMWFGGNGYGSHNPVNDGNGLYWPCGIEGRKSSIFQDGLLFGGNIDGEARVYGSMFRTSMQPGNIDTNGQVGNPEDTQFSIRKTRNDWELLPDGDEKNRLKNDWYHWPVHLGAPYIDNDFDGFYNPEIDNPVAYGDEINWMVMNTADDELSSFLYGIPGIAIESQLSIYAYKRDDDLKDVVFKQYRLYNKSEKDVKDMFFAYWSDPDLGDASDDYVGCDSLLNLMYCYNATNYDDIYGLPPAVGYLLLQGPIVSSLQTDSAYFFSKWIEGYKNSESTSFTPFINGDNFFRDPSSGMTQGSSEMYNYFNGRNWQGIEFTNPVLNKKTKFIFNGDPVKQSGWYEELYWPDGVPFTDHRMMLSSGPFDMAAGDSQEVVYAIIMAQGEDHLDSITKLKEKALAVRNFYYTGVLTSLEEEGNNLNPKSFALHQNYPNPFNPTTIMNYDLRFTSDVKLIVYDVLGREVKTLVNKTKQAGSHKITFNASNLSSGVYYYKLKARPSTGSGIKFEQTRKMLLLR